MSSVLIVGGNGFLGSHLADRLVADKHQVAVFDRFSSGRPRYKAEGVRAVVGDLSDVSKLAKAMHGVDEVYHFVSPTTPATAADDPVADVRDGLPRSIALLQTAVDAHVGRVVFASSGGTVYGDQSIAAFSELNVPRPVSPYAIGKLAVEGYLRYFRATYGLDTVALRVSNPYGLRQAGTRGHGFIAIAVNAALHDKTITVFGDGSMVRDYVNVQDVVATIAKMAGQPHAHEEYNIGSGRGVTLTELLSIIERVTGRTLRVRFAEAPPSFVQHSVLDIGRVVREYGVLPVIPLDEGVAEVWEQLRSDGE